MFDSVTTYGADASVLKGMDIYASGAGVTLLVSFLVLCLVLIIELAIVYKKAGKPAIASFIPIYNLWVFLEIGDLPGWLCLVPVANAIAMLVAYFKIPKKFGKSGAFGLGLMFLPIIFFGILAFSKSTNTKNKREEKVSDAKESEMPNLMAEESTASSSATPNLMAEQATPNLMAEQVTFKEENVEPEKGMSANEMPALDVEEKIEETPKEESVNSEAPVSGNIPDVFDMPMPVNNTVIDNASLPKQEVSLEAAPLEETITESLDAPLADTLLEEKPEVIENLEENIDEMPKMVNEEINSDITVTKMCKNCNHENPYVNKFCEICGTPLE